MSNLHNTGYKTKSDKIVNSVKTVERCLASARFSTAARGSRGEGWGGGANPVIQPNTTYYTELIP